MNILTHRKLLALICAGGLCGGAAAMGQDAADASKANQAAPGKVDEAAMMAQMMELAKPGENHKTLERFVGSWTYRVKYWLTPEKTNVPPIESSGTTVTKSTMGGRYFISEHNGQMQIPGPDGTMQSMPFSGMAVQGYDNVKRKFVASWIDNGGTSIMMLEGTFDADANTLTYVADYEPMPGMKTKVREAITMTDQNHHTMTWFEHRGDKEVKTMEITYTRSGGAGS